MGVIIQLFHELGLKNSICELNSCHFEDGPDCIHKLLQLHFFGGRRLACNQVGNKISPPAYATMLADIQASQLCNLPTHRVLVGFALEKRGIKKFFDIIVRLFVILPVGIFTQLLLEFLGSLAVFGGCTDFFQILNEDVVLNAGQGYILLVIGQAVHSLIDLSLGMFLLLVRTIAELAVVELLVQILLLLDSCFYESLFLL